MKSHIKVPAAPFKKILERMMSNLPESARNGGTSWVGDRLGLNTRSVHRILSQDKIDFATADRVVSKCPEGPFLWVNDPELSEIYNSVDFTIIDLVTPIDAPTPIAHARDKIIAAWDSHKTKKAAARSLGMNGVTFSRKLDEHLLSVGREPAADYHKTPICPRGHNKDEVGRTKSDRCKQCHTEDNQARKHRVTA